jgi:putative membrane protein
MKLSKIQILSVVFLSGATLSSICLAANERPVSPSSEPAYRADSSTISHSDRTFLEKAAKGGMKEVDISKAVQGRVVDSQIKSMTQMMIADHSATNAELSALAARKGVVLPSNDMKVVEKWSKKDKDLDEDYIEEMKDDHEEAVKLFEKGAKSDDPEIAAFASKTLPGLQNHLSMIKELKKMK